MFEKNTVKRLVTNHYKTLDYEKPMKMPWKYHESIFMTHKTRILKFITFINPLFQ